jgi:predicted transcriptional regulator
VSAPVNSNTREWIDAEAKRQRRSRAEIVRFAIEEYRERIDAQDAAA